MLDLTGIPYLNNMLSIQLFEFLGQRTSQNDGDL